MTLVRVWYHNCGRVLLIASVDETNRVELYAWHVSYNDTNVLIEILKSVFKMNWEYGNVYWKTFRASRLRFLTLVFIMNFILFALTFNFVKIRDYVCALSCTCARPYFLRDIRLRLLVVLVLVCLLHTSMLTETVLKNTSFPAFWEWTLNRNPNLKNECENDINGGNWLQALFRQASLFLPALLLFSSVHLFFLLFIHTEYWIWRLVFPTYVVVVTLNNPARKGLKVWIINV